MPPTPFPGMQTWDVPHKMGHEQRRGRWLMYADYAQGTVFIDLAAWPPYLVTLDQELVCSFDVFADGRVAVCSRPIEPDARFAVTIHESGWPIQADAEAPMVLSVPQVSEIWTIGNKLVAFDCLMKADGDTRAYVQSGKQFRPVKELPAFRLETREVPRMVRGQPDGTSTISDHFANGKVTLNDGTEVLIWDGDGYELKRGRFVKTWDLGVKDNVLLGGWTAVPWGADGFFYLSNRRVFFARRGTAPMPMMPDVFVNFLSPGPEGSVIANLAKGDTRDVVRVWFPAEGTYMPIVRKHLGVAPHFWPAELYWSEFTHQVYAKWNGLTTFPEADLLALKRMKTKDGVAGW